MLIYEAEMDHRLQVRVNVTGTVFNTLTINEVLSIKF